MKIIVSKNQFEKILSEQTAYEFKLDKIYSDPNKAQEYNQTLKNLVLDNETNLRDFLYSPEGIAAVTGINLFGGELLTTLLFSVLVAYDIEQWIREGEPNWLYLITDIICVSTAGFASGTASTLINTAKKIKFNSLENFLLWLEKTFPSIWKNNILPLKDAISTQVKNITNYLSKYKTTTNNKLFVLPKNISNILSNVTSYLQKLAQIFEENISKVIGKKTLKTGQTYAKFKTSNQIVSNLEKTKTGKKITKKLLPYINPLLGSDKVDDFIIDLIKIGDINQSPKKMDLTKYKIFPIFRDNSQDTF
jgi:hypothetical protein